MGLETAGLTALSRYHPSNGKVDGDATSHPPPQMGDKSDNLKGKNVILAANLSLGTVVHTYYTLAFLPTHLTHPQFSNFQMYDF